MLKSIVMMDLPIDDIAPMERWYYEAHSSEISRRMLRHGPNSSGGSSGEYWTMGASLIQPCRVSDEGLGFVKLFCAGE